MKALIYFIAISLLVVGILHVSLSKPVLEKTGYLGGETLGIEIAYGDPNVPSKRFPDFFETNVKSILEDKSGDYSIYIKHLLTKQTIIINPNSNYYLASLYKIPVAIVTLQDVQSNKIKLTDKIKFTNDDIYYGTGSIQYDELGSEYTVETLLQKLMKDSDNIAQNMLLTVIDKKEVDKYIKDPDNVSVLEMTAILENLYSGKYLNQQNTNLIFEYMTSTSFDDRVNLGLTEGVTFAHKIGNWGETGSWHDCGVILDNSNPIVICIMSKNTTYEEFLDVSKEVGQNINKILY